MKKILQISTAYLVCALFTCLMIKGILGIGSKEGLLIRHELSTEQGRPMIFHHRGSVS